MGLKIVCIVWRYGIFDNELRERVRGKKDWKMKGRRRIKRDFSLSSQDCFHHVLPVLFTGASVSIEIQRFLPGSAIR